MRPRNSGAFWRRPGGRAGAERLVGRQLSAGSRDQSALDVIEMVVSVTMAVEQVGARAASELLDQGIGRPGYQCVEAVGRLERQSRQILPPRCRPSTGGVLRLPGAPRR